MSIKITKLDDKYKLKINKLKYDYDKPFKREMPPYFPNKFSNVLFVGKPASGKTTLLTNMLF